MPEPMEDLVSRMLACDRVAVVGATNRKHKFGYRIFADLRAKGYQVAPVHPILREVDGVACHKRLADLPLPPQVVCCVVPSAVTLRVVGEAADLGVPFVWMQPGAESAEAIALCEERAIACIHDQCIMILST